MGDVEMREKNIRKSLKMLSKRYWKMEKELTKLYLKKQWQDAEIMRREIQEVADRVNRLHGYSHRKNITE